MKKAVRYFLLAAGNILVCAMFTSITLYADIRDSLLIVAAIGVFVQVFVNVKIFGSYNIRFRTQGITFWLCAALPPFVLSGLLTAAVAVMKRSESLAEEWDILLEIAGFSVLTFFIYSGVFAMALWALVGRKKG